MARVKKITCHKLPASSLLEVMVALVVMFTVFGISMGLYVNVVGSSQSLQKTKAMAELENIASDTRKKQEFIDAGIQRDGFKIEKTVKPYPGIPDALILHLKAINLDNKEIAELREIVIMEK